MATSTYFAILEAVRARLAAVQGIPPVSIRKRPLPFADEVAPLCIVSPADGERSGLETFTAGVVYEYPVFVALYMVGDQTLEIGVESLLELRERVRNELYQPALPDVTAAYDLDLEPQAAFDWSAQVGSRYEVTGFRAVYKVTETRVA